MIEQVQEDWLVLAAQNGNEQAFAALHQLYHSRLYRFAYQMCGDTELASDALQDTWVQCAKSLYKLEDPRAFKSWLYRLTKWRVADIQRKVTRNEKVVDCVEDVSVLEQQQSQPIEGATTVESTAILQAIRSLPEVERQVVQLFYLEEMEVKEVALILEIPVGTVKSRLSRARHLLKSKFERG